MADAVLFPILSAWMALNFGANLATQALCIIGYRAR
jgi:hypothetical protein